MALQTDLPRTGDSTLIDHFEQGGFAYLLSSKLKTTCSALSAFVKSHELGNPLISSNQVASLARGVAFAKSHNNRWSNTHETAFCLKALIDYAQTMESDVQIRRPKALLSLKNGRRLINMRRKSVGGRNSNSYVFSTSLKPNYLDQIGEFEITKNGRGRIYYEASLRYEPTEFSHEKENRGIDIRRIYWIQDGKDWIQVNETTPLFRGQIVHVDVYLHVRDPRSYVVVDDPVPGALEPINTQLANAPTQGVRRDRSLDEAVKRATGIEEINVRGRFRRGFYHRELNHDSVRFYSDHLNSGTYLLKWTGQVIATGDFIARSNTFRSHVFAGRLRQITCTSLESPRYLDPGYPVAITATRIRKHCSIWPIQFALGLHLNRESRTYAAEMSFRTIVELTIH